MIIILIIYLTIHPEFSYSPTRWHLSFFSWYHDNMRGDLCLFALIYQKFELLILLADSEDEFTYKVNA